MLGALNAAGRLASSFLMGSTLTAMLLGHYYLTAPAMSIEPLKRFVRCMAWGLAARAVLAAAGLVGLATATSRSQSGGDDALVLPRDPLGDGVRRGRPWPPS